MKKLLKLIQTDIKAAFKYFSDEVEVSDATSLAKQCTTLGLDTEASLIGEFITAYETDTDWVAAGTKTNGKPKPKTKPKTKPKPKPKPKTPQVEKAIYQPYHDNGGLGVLDYYADQIELEYDPLTMISSRYRIKRSKDSAEVRCKYLAKLWHQAIEFAQEDGDQNWFTRIVRHQISAQTKADLALRKKSLRGIPMPKDA